jgi:Domain of unknown function (DUF4286)
MILYNITVSIALLEATNFENWIKAEKTYLANHCPSAFEFKSLKLLMQIDPNACNYALQFSIENKNKLEVFEKTEIDVFLSKINLVFEGQFAYFTTILEAF